MNRQLLLAQLEILLWRIDVDQASVVVDRHVEQIVLVSAHH